MGVAAGNPGNQTSFHEDVRPGPGSLAIPCQASPPTRSSETGGLEYAGRVLCLALKGFLSLGILPLPTQKPDGPI
jgi:hypothetical protein